MDRKVTSVMVTRQDIIIMIIIIITIISIIIITIIAGLFMINIATSTYSCRIRICAADPCVRGVCDGGRGPLAALRGTSSSVSE